ncbi:MAG: DUF1549 and DUF1553 domain-containing protein [Opitutales bacterium]|nr:DUF1549 and DUF1553 domain-containing protein [Opitutales bacterium]
MNQSNCLIRITWFILLLLSSALQAELTRAEWAATQQIDHLVNEGIHRAEKLPLPLTDDYTFARRVYLDAIGRIPSLAELQQFIADDDPLKRFHLVDKLLEHPGYVSHQFNFWADLLRIQSRTRQDGVGEAYAAWVKDAVRSNMPYDAFVRALITAEGYAWENGAIGYTMRDANMPLDNLSNTVQVFLGTQIVCAQCHDHPYDAWTQSEYYEMAAFTYGLHTRVDRRKMPAFVDLQKQISSSQLERSEKQMIRRSAAQLFRPLVDGVAHTRRELKMPHDYKYSDAEPGEVVEPYVIFGKTHIEPTIDNRLEVFGRWLSNPGNPRFARVMANRIWRELMGVGLFEPVDDYSQDIAVSNPELLEFLEKTFVESGFDIRSLQRIILNSQAYQRESVGYTPEHYAHYVFEGQQLERMSAEQIWDSIMTLIVEDPERVQRSFDPDVTFAMQKGLLELSPYLGAHLSLEYTELTQKLYKEIQEIQKARDMARAAGDDEGYRNAQASIRPLIRERRNLGDKLIAKYTGISGGIQNGSMSVGMVNPRDSDNEYIKEMDNQARERSREIARAERRMRSLRYARASELFSPAPSDHLLRAMGQSDREMIDNFSLEPSVPQILGFLNGSWHERIWTRSSPLSQALDKQYEPKAQIDTIFLSLLSRPPKEREQRILEPSFYETPASAAIELVWAIINTRQFIFIQ